MSKRTRRVLLSLASCAGLACGSSDEGAVVVPVDSSLDAGGGSNPDGAVAPDAPVSPPAGTTVVYVARRGVSTPWIFPIDSSGVGESLRLAPRRGAGYGQGEGDVSYPDITPDGKHVVVVFYPMATPSSSGTGGAVVFALPMDGSGADSPVRVAEAAQLHALERAYEGGWMAYVDGSSIFAARLDGSDAGKPVAVATAPQGQELDNLRWASEGQTLTWTRRSSSSGQDRKVFASTIAPGGASEPKQIHTGSGPAEWVAGVMPGDRLLVGAADDRLHAVSIGAGAPVVLTPDGQIAGLVGVSHDGLRAVVELRVTWKEERQLVSVATDGSEAEAPVFLTPFPTRKLHAIISRDRTAVAWTGQNESAQWAAFRAGVQGLGPGEQARITDFGSKELHVTDFDASAGALVGSRQDGAVLRFGALHGEPAPPQVLHVVEDVVNHGIPWPALSADCSMVIYDASTAQGWQSWAVPLTGGVPTELPGAPWYRDLLGPHGVLYHEYVNEGALYSTGLDGGAALLVPWHDTEVLDPHLVDGDRSVLYACDTPTPGFYAAPADPPAEPKQVLVMPADIEPTPYQTFWGARPQVAGGHLVRRTGTTVRSFALDGSDSPAGHILGESTQTPLAADPLSSRAAFVTGAGVVSVPVDASSGPATLMEVGEGQHVSDIAMLPGTDQLLVVRSGPGPGSLHRVPVAGGAAPTLVAGDLDGWYMVVAPSATSEHVFIVLSIEATAVPHPDALVAAATGIGGAAPSGAAYAVAPPKYMLWHPGQMLGGPGLVSVEGPVTSGDGVHVILVGPGGLYAATSDGSEAGEPRLLGSATAPLGQTLAPDGMRILLQEDQAVVIASLDQALSQRRLTPPVDGTLSTARFTPDGKRVVFAAASSASFGSKGALRVVDASAELEPGTALHSEELAITAFLGIVPSGEAAIVQSTHGADHSLYLVPLDGSSAGGIPPALTPVDDVGEQLVGLRAAP